MAAIALASDAHGGFAPDVAFARVVDRTFAAEVPFAWVVDGTFAAAAQFATVADGTFAANVAFVSGAKAMRCEFVSFAEGRGRDLPAGTPIARGAGIPSAARMGVSTLATRIAGRLRPSAPAVAAMVG